MMMMMMMIIIITIKLIKIMMMTAVISRLSVENKNGYSFVVVQRFLCSNASLVSEGIQLHLICLIARKISMVEWVII
jgi:hypothetical protein